MRVIDGADTKYSNFNRIEVAIYNKIWARNGAFCSDQ